MSRQALGISVSALEKMAGIRELGLSKFIAKWAPWFNNKYESEWVKVPEGEDLDKAQAMFEKCGLAGFVSSMDVVHIKYDRCPWGQRAIHTGKEGYPTLGFQFHCGHNRKIF